MNSFVLAHYGTFDVDNYGDLLFPHIAEWRIPEATWCHISPKGGKTLFEDSLDVISFQSCLDQTFDAALVGGGNIVHMRKSNLAEYRSLAESAYASLWLGANEIASKRNIPLIFNGPSISYFDLGVIEKLAFKWVFRNTQYAGFREKYSLNLAGHLSTFRTSLVPDTAFDISRMWPFPEFKSGDYLSDYFTVHVNKRYIQSMEETALAIDQIAIHLNATARILPIGPCHGDLECAEKVSKLMTTKPYVVKDLSLKGFARDIAGAKMYVGSSMHGFITALSYGTPGILVLNDKPMNKFLGLLDLANITEEVICKSWYSASLNTHKAAVLSDEVKHNLFRMLDTHWQNVNDSLVKPNSKCSSKVPALWKFLLPLSKLEKMFRRAINVFR